MKKTVLLFLVFFVFGLLSCERETTSHSDGFAFTLRSVQADIQEESVTKTHLSTGGNVLWDADDVIGVFSDTQNPVAFYNNGSQGTTSTQFSGDPVSGQTFYAYYPYSGFTLNPSQRTQLSCTLPGPVEGSNPFLQLPMVAQFNGSQFYFRQICGILHFQLTGAYSVKSLTLEGNNQEPLNGSGIVDVSGSNPEFRLTNAASASKSVVISFTTPKALSQDIWDVYFPVPPQTFSKGITLTIQYMDGSQEKTFKKKTEQSITVSRADMKNFSVVDLSPAPHDFTYDFHTEGSSGWFDGYAFIQTGYVTTYPNPIGFNCSAGFNGTTTQDWMQEHIYNAYGDAASFHAQYTFNGMNGYAYNVAYNTGELGTVTEFNDPEHGCRLVNWLLTPDEIWSVATRITQPREIVRHCTYSYQDEVITLSLKLTVAPFSDVFDLYSTDDYIAQYWESHWNQPQFAATIFHVATPPLDSTDPDLCTFVSDLNAPFITCTGSEGALYPAGTLKVGRDTDGNGSKDVRANTIRYFFHLQNEVGTPKTFSDGVNIVNNVYVRRAKFIGTWPAYTTPPALIPFTMGANVVFPAAATPENQYDVLVAWAPAGIPSAFQLADITNYEVIAWIRNDGTFVGAYNTIAYNEQSDLAKDLLNTNAFYAYIGATGNICEAPATIHEVKIRFDGKYYFKGDFLRPVSISTYAPGMIRDDVDFGTPGSYLRYEDIVRPYDWRFTWNVYNSNFDSGHDNYWGYYGIDPDPGFAGAPGHFIIHADLDGATCTLGGPNDPVPATIVLQANEIDNNPAYAVWAWDSYNPMRLTPANDADWYTDLAGVNTKVYSYNRTSATPIEYTFTSADIAANRLSQYGYLTYYNTGVTVGAFDLNIPMEVHYKWGKLRTKVRVRVDVAI